MNTHSSTTNKGKKKGKKAVRVTALFDSDKILAKLTEKFLNVEYEQMKNVLDAVMLARLYFENVYLIDSPDFIWDRIMKEVVELRMNDWKMSKNSK